MLPSIIVCCYNVIFYVMDNQLQSTTSHQLKYKWKNYHKKTRTDHHKGISQGIISQPLQSHHGHKSLQEVPTSSLGPTSKGYIPEYWTEIFIFISNTSLPLFSKILKTKLFQWMSNTIYSI